MAEEKDVLLKIKVDSEKALQAVKQYTGEVESLKRTQNNLKLALKELEAEREKEWQAYKKGEKSIQDYNKVAEESRKTEARIKEQLAMNSAQLANTSQNLRGYQKELQNVLKQQEALSNDSDGSLVSLRAELSNVTKAFDNLSRAEREGAKGKEFLDHINALTDEIKEAEEATQRYQRNVGNYKSALEGAEKAVGGLTDGVLGFISGGNPLVAMLANTASQLGSVKKAFSVAGQGAVMLGKQMWALVANPIGAFLTLATTLLLALKKGLESSEERMNRFKQMTASLQGVFDIITKAIGAVCDVLLTLIEYYGKAVDYIMGVSEMQKEYLAIEKQAQEITKQTREEIVNTAKREKEVSELRAKFAEKDKYTNKERLAFLDQAIAKEKEQAEANKKIAEMKFENLKRSAAMSENNAEMNDKLAEAEAEVLKQEKALSDKMRELNAQRVEAINSIKAEEEAEKKKAKEKAKAAADALKERQEKELEALRGAEDAMNEIIEDNVQKQRAMLLTAYTRQIEDIQKRLDTEKNLTITARQALQQQMLALDEKYAQDVEALDKEIAERRAQVERDTQLAMLHGNEDAILQAKITMKQEEIDAMHRMENESEAEFNLRKLQASNELADMQKEQRIKVQQQEIEEQALALETKLAQLHNDEMAQLEAKLEAKRTEIDAMHQMEEESDAEFKLRQLEAENEFADMEKEIADKKKKIAQDEAKTKRDAYNSVMQAMTAMGEHSKALGKVSKIMGLAQIAVDTGKAISAGVAEAVKIGFPQNLAAIATTVATVLANMATAMTSIKSAKFATGGLVEGAGSGTSDSIPAMLSNGESVITAQATSAFAPILSTLNQLGGGVPIDVGGIGNQQMGEEMLARAFARGVSELRPVVSVEEINRVSNNVRVIESLATING
jgi:myosin heavy subunit